MTNETIWCIAMAIFIAFISGYGLGRADHEGDSIIFTPKFNNPPLIEKANG